MALFILLFLHLILEVYLLDPSKPELWVSSEVISQNGSVKLDCRTHHQVNQCYFYPKGQETKLKLASSCELSLTGSELIMWTGRHSDSIVPVSVVCFYSVSVSGVLMPSSHHSSPASVVILDQKPTMHVHYDSQQDVFTAVCEISLSESVSAEFRCHLYTGDKVFLKAESQRKNLRKLSCLLTASKNDLLNYLQSEHSREVSCDYSLNSTRSPMSDKINISDLLSTTTQPSTTEQKSTAVSTIPLITSKSPMTTTLFVALHTTFSTKTPGTASVWTKVTQQKQTHPPKYSLTARTVVPSTTVKLTKTTAIQQIPQRSHSISPLLIIAVSATATSVLLSGVMIIIACGFLKKQRRKRFKINSKAADQVCMTAMVSIQEPCVAASEVSDISPASSQPSGNMIPIKNCDRSGPQAETYSEITSIAAPPEPSGTSKVKENSECPQSDVYHMYYTIPDLQVTSFQNDTVYSLLQKH